MRSTNNGGAEHVNKSKKASAEKQASFDHGMIEMDDRISVWDAQSCRGQKVSEMTTGAQNQLMRRKSHVEKSTGEEECIYIAPKKLIKA